MLLSSVVVIVGWKSLDGGNSLMRMELSFRKMCLHLNQIRVQLYR